MQVQISDAKNKLRSADDYRQLVGSFFEQTVADVYEGYQRELHRANAMDFDDLLFRAVDLLTLFQEVRDRYAKRVPLHPRRRVPGHERRPVPLAPAALLRAPQPRGGRRRRAVPRGGDAGDDGRRDGQADRGASRSATRSCSCYGSGDFRPARVLRTHRSDRAARVAITTRSGPADREHARARPLRRLQAAREPAAAHDLPAVAPGHGLPRRDDPDLAATGGAPARERRRAAGDAGARGRGVGALDARDARPRRASRRRSSRSSTRSRRCPSPRGGRPRRAASSPTST